MVSPVISKILMILGSTTTTRMSPPNSRHRFRPPTSTPKRRRVEKRDLEEVEGHGRVALGDDVVETFTQLGGGGHVDLPADRDDRDGPVPTLFDLKFLFHVFLPHHQWGQGRAIPEVMQR